MSFLLNFENSQIKQWIPHYIDYRKINDFILSILNEYELDKKKESQSENNNIHKERKRTLSSNSLEIKAIKINELSRSTYSEEFIFNSVDKKKLHLSNFISQIDEEKKKVYLFYLEKEKLIFNNISLCIKERASYDYKTINELQKEIDNLEYLSELLKEIGLFLYENLNALKKLLKKFDKKLGKYLGKIYHSYFKDSFKKDSSDLTYLLNYKIIDETSVMIQELIEEAIQISMKKINSNNNNNNDIDIDELTNSFKLSKRQIMMNISEINVNYNKLYSLFTNYVKYIKLNKVGLPLEKENEISLEGQSLALDENLSSFEVKSKKSIEEMTLSQKHFFYYSNENKTNIFFILFHTFIYMFLYSVEIPIVILFSIYKNSFSLLGWIFLMTPIGILISYLISHFFHHRTFKLPLLISSFFIFAHCGLFISVYKIKQFWILMISQVCLGIGSNRVLNKLYLNNYIPKEKEKYSKYLKYVATIGISLGLFLSSFLVYLIPVTFDSITMFSTNFISAFLFQTIIFVVYFFWLCVLVIKFREPLGKKFEIYHENLFNNEKLMDKPVLGQQLINDISKANTKFSQINIKEQYIDLNLPERFLNKIVNINTKTKVYFSKLFITFLLIKLSVKYTNEMLFIYIPISSFEQNIKEVSLAIYIINSVSYCISYPIAFYYNYFRFFKSRKTLILLLLFSIGMTFMLGKYKDSISNEVMFTGTFCLMFFVNVLDVLSVNIFNKIIPKNFMLGGKVNGSTLINVLIEYIKMVVCIFIIAFHSNEYSPFITTNIIIFTSTLLLIVSLILSIIFYKQMKTLSITRVMNQMN